MAFVHLHTHSCYSMLDGKSTPEEMVLRAKELGQNAIAITDHGVLFGVVEFYNMAKKHGIHPIIGCEVYVAPMSRFDKSGESFRGEGGKNYYHLILLAENNTGYQNLMKLVSLSFTEGYYYKPRVDKELLAKYHEGLIATSACLGGSLNQKLIGEHYTGNVTPEAYEAAKNEAVWYRDTFGKNNFFIELQNHFLPEQLTNNPYLEKIADEIGVSCIVANDAHYARRSDAAAHDVLLCIQTKAYLSEENRFRFSSEDFYIKSEEEMAALFPGKQKYLDNTQKIADRCSVTFPPKTYKLPKFEVPKEYEGRHGEYLTNLCRDNFDKLYPNGEGWTDEHAIRFQKELQVIEEMGFTDYFLIVQDYINWAKSQGIFVGPSRGSSAGSLICYLLGITSLTDPVEYDLIFERFLNKSRVSMPDIDTDFQKDRREEVIDYVRQKYGEEKVSNIVAINTMKAKQAFQDVARVYQLPYQESLSVTKLFPNTPNITLEEALEESPKLKEAVENNPNYQKIFDIAKQIEGLPRNVSIHASGVVICSDDIRKFAPIMTVDGQTVVQFPMETAEAIGLIKMDFLSLRTLDTIDYCTRFIHEKKDKEFDIGKVPLTDVKTFQMLDKGDTAGVFQFESSGMTQYMKELKPQNISELAVLNAMYRPGPMDYIPEYIARKKNPALISYTLDTPEVREILQSTNGIVVYQESCMQIFQKVAGFSLGRADLVRKAMGKKKDDIMQEEFRHFKEGLHDEKNDIIGTRAKGIPDEKADAILNQMKDFSKYAFNKSHAVAYSVVAYQTAYLKCHYPTEFMAAMISSYIGNNEKLAHYISVAVDMKIQILPPDINRSEELFLPVEDGKILFSLTGIKSVGEKVSAAILKERRAGGEFASFFDFLSRTRKYGIGASTIEALIQTGAFQFTGKSRTSLLAALPNLLKIAQDSFSRKKNGQKSIFTHLSPSVAESVSMPEEVVLPDRKEAVNIWEKDLTSLYISYDPLENYQTYLKDERILTPETLLRGFEQKLPGFAPKNQVYLLAVLGDIRSFQTKKGDFMAKPVLESKTASVSALAFPKVYGSLDYGPVLKQKNAVVLINGRIGDNEDVPEIIISEAAFAREDAYFEGKGVKDIYYELSLDKFHLKKPLATRVSGKRQNIVSEMNVNGKPKGIYVRVPKEKETVFAQIVKAHPGKSELFLVRGSDVFAFGQKVRKDTSSQQDFLDHFGAENVFVE